MTRPSLARTLFLPLVTALGFLTRLAPARTVDPKDMARALPWLPAAGLILGLVLVLPLTPQVLGISLAGHPLAQAWLVLLGSAWLTRGLHFDGLADLADAHTAHLDPDRFWTVLKDSRIGVFGVLALVLVCAGQLALLTGLLAEARLWTVAWAFMAGRAAAVVLACAARPLARKSGLGATFLAGADPTPVTIATLATLGLGLVMATPSTVVLAALMALIPLAVLYDTAKKVGGLNGDFLGAACLCVETTTLLAGVVLL